MKKSCMFSILFYIILVNVFHLQARNEQQPHFSVSYALQQDTSNNSIQFPSVEQSRGSFSHPKNYTYGSFEYKQALLNRSGSVIIAQKKYLVTREDYDLIQKICLDNPDQNKDELWKTLLQCFFINDAAILMKGIQPFQYMESDIYINKAHYFIYENEKYFIEDIASYHIHAGDYYRKNLPKGGHSNYGGHKLDCFKPEVIKHGPIGAKDVLFYNSRNINLIKPSSIYPEAWSEFVCDLKAIEVMMSKNADILNDGFGSLKITGKTTEGLDLVIYYDIVHKRIKSHYPDSEKF